MNCPAWVLALTIVAVGCASTTANTPTGKAEIYISKDSADAYRDGLVSGMVDRGYSTLDVTPYKISFDKEGGTGTDILIGTGSRKRVTFDFAPVADQFRVIGKLEILDGSGRVQSSKSSQDIMDFMQSVANSLPPRALPAREASPSNPDSTTR